MRTLGEELHESWFCCTSRKAEVIRRMDISPAEVQVEEGGYPVWGECLSGITCVYQCGETFSDFGLRNKMVLRGVRSV